MAIGSITGGLLTGVGATGLRAPRPLAGQGGFTVPSDFSEASASGETCGVTATSLGTLLALQEVDTPTERDRKAHRHAEQMLDELQALQREMLGHQPDPGRLDRLSGLARSWPNATHPGLRAAVAAVAMRVELEITRQTLSRQLFSVAKGE